MKPTLLLIHDTRRPKQNGAYPVKLRITFNRKQKYYPVGIDLLPRQWDNLKGERLKSPQKQLNEELIGFQGKAKNIIDDMKAFSFIAFEKLFYNTSITSGNLIGMYLGYIEKLKKEGRINTASSFECSINSLKSYKSKLDFEHITPDFLAAYEAWMVNNGKSITSVGIYLRALRTIFNEAIGGGFISKELYPFGKRKYEIPAARNIKKALTLADVKKIHTYQSIEGSSEQRAKDFWMFCYLCNGINVKDIAQLKYKNMNGDFIEFVRAKTKRSTRTNQRTISIYLIPEAKEIIQKWANKEEYPENYIFPIISNSMDAEKQHAAIKQFTKTTNKYVSKIAVTLGIEKHVTTYTARHTFSTVLKRAGANTEIISEALGHANKKTTDSYLDSFEKDTQKEYAEKLMNFNAE